MASLIVRDLQVTFSPLIKCPRLSSSQSRVLGVSLSSTSSQSVPFAYNGRGDKKTAKGKRFIHSFGNARPPAMKKGRGPLAVPVLPV